MKIFFSYPHDENSELVMRFKDELTKRGHEVWFDAEKIKEGDDWRARITRGISESDQVIAFLSKHAVREPGVCLNEIAIALADKGEALVTVLVEPELVVGTPVSITHIQWLRMEDWKTEMKNDGWFKVKLERLVAAIENPENAGRNDELETLRQALDPMSFYAEIASHIPGFTGRDWLISRYGNWLTNEPESRVLRIEGGPGLGKTALASYLAHSAKSSVLAIHLCQYSKGESRNPLRLVRTLAYQLATRLPDFRARLLKSVSIQDPKTMQGKDAASLWSDLISAPMSGSGRGNIDRQRLAIIIDGLDEATVDGKNPIVELLMTEIDSLPKWIGVVLTGRPDPELTQRLSRYKPQTLSDEDPQNLADLKVYADEWMSLEVAKGTITAHQAKISSQSLLEKCEGAFLYLVQARNAVAEGILKLDQATSFPSGLNEIYLRSFERRFPNAIEDESSYKQKVRPLLELVIASPEPLPVSIAREVLHWDPYAEATVLKSLGSLLKRSRARDEETLSPFHYSVREWLVDANAAGDFFVSSAASVYPLTNVAWRRYAKKFRDLWPDEKMPIGQFYLDYFRTRIDDYEVSVLTLHLPNLSEQQRSLILTPLDWITSQLIQGLAHFNSNGSKSVASFWEFQIGISERIADSDLDNSAFAESLSDSYECYARRLGETQIALELFKKGLAIRERLAVHSSENIRFERKLLESYSNFMDFQVALGDVPEALDVYHKFLGIVEKNEKANRKDWDHLNYLAKDFGCLSHFQESVSNIQAATDLAQRGAQIFQDMQSAGPLRKRLEGLFHLGNLQKDKGETQAFLNTYKEALAVNDLLTQCEPEKWHHVFTLRSINETLGDTQKALGNIESALEYYRAAPVADEKFFKIEPLGIESIQRLITAYFNTTISLINAGDAAGALEYQEKGQQLLERMSQNAPENVEFRNLLLKHYTRHAQIQQRSFGNNKAALELHRKALAIHETMLHSTPNDPGVAINLRSTYSRLGELHKSVGSVQDALECFQKALSIDERFMSIWPENHVFAQCLSDDYNAIGEIQMALGDTFRAIEFHKKALANSERLEQINPKDGDNLRLSCAAYYHLANCEHDSEKIRWRKQLVAALERLKKLDGLNENDERMLHSALGGTFTQDYPSPTP